MLAEGKKTRKHSLSSFERNQTAGLHGNELPAKSGAGINKTKQNKLHGVYVCWAIYQPFNHDLDFGFSET